MLLLTACAAPAAPPARTTALPAERPRSPDSLKPTPHLLEPLLLSEMEPLIPRPGVLPLIPRCASPKAPPRAPGGTQYDFAELMVEPLDHGPRIAEKPRVGIPVAPEELAARLTAHRALLKSCYRWSRSKCPDLMGDLELQLTLDPLGNLISLTATPLVSAAPGMTGGQQLARCVEDVLGDLALDRIPLRQVQARVTLRFKRSGQVMPRRIRRPGPTHARPRLSRGVCVSIPRDPEVDFISPAQPVLEVNDFDQRQAYLEEERKRRAENRRAARRCEELRRSGKKCFPKYRPGRPRIVAHRVQIPACLSSETVQRPLMQNLGAYRRCYRSALGRGTTAEGLVVIRGVIDEGGGVQASVASFTVKDPDLIKCLRQAVAEVWYFPLATEASRHRRLGGIIFTLPLKLVSVAPPSDPVRIPRRAHLKQVEQLAAQALAQHDGQKALARYSALLRQRPTHLRACTWHAGVFRAARLMSPWIDQSVLAAAEVLLRHARAMPDQAAARACLTAVAAPLAELATTPHRMGNRLGSKALQALAVRRYRWLLTTHHELPDSCTLRYYLYDALLSLGRWNQAREAYRDLAGEYRADPSTEDVQKAIDACKKQERALTPFRNHP